MGASALITQARDRTELTQAHLPQGAGTSQPTLGVHETGATSWSMLT